MKCPRLGVAPALLSGLLVPQEAGPPVFRADIELVTVDVVVLDRGGEPVAGLTREDFELLDGGEPREILSFEALDLGAPNELATREQRRVSTNVHASPSSGSRSSTTRLSGNLNAVSPPGRVLPRETR